MIGSRKRCTDRRGGEGKDACVKVCVRLCEGECEGVCVCVCVYVCVCEARDKR